MYDFTCEHCGGQIQTRRVEREALRHKGSFVILEDVPIGVCAKCGTKNAEGVKYCTNCGSMLDVAKAAGSTTSLEPNIAGLLCYLAGWITGLIFILIEKENKFVRFHAMQSIVTFGALTVLWIVFGALWFIPVVGALLSAIAWILGVILWIVLMVKAYQGERFKLPIAGDFAEKNS